VAEEVVVDGRGTTDEWDELEAALWRRGLDAAGVDEVLGLADQLARRAAGVAHHLGILEGGKRARERLSEGSGAGVETAGLESGPELAAELAAKVVPTRGVSEAGACACVRTDGPLSRAAVSPVQQVAEVGEGARACRACRRVLPASAFYRKGGATAERRATCKACEGARRAVRRRELAAVRELSRRGADAQALLAFLEARRQADREAALVALRVASLGGPERALVADLLEATRERLALAPSRAEAGLVAAFEVGGVGA
jgi:hypothetical protein